MKRGKRLAALSLGIIIGLTACSPKVDTRSSKQNSNKENSKTSENSKKSVNNASVHSGVDGDISLGDLKTKYDDNSLNNYGQVFSPMYNVGLDSSFTFHFKSKVDPYHAVTIHTSEKCNLDSRMNLENTAYLTSDGGVDIVVNEYEDGKDWNLGDPVLESDDRLDADIKNIWGNAQIYYMSINYDLDATTPTKLDKPIIIPFTLKKDVIAPMLNYKISQYGDYSLKWEDVGADKYRIYKAHILFIEDDTEYIAKDRCYYSLRYELCNEVSGDTTEYMVSKESDFFQNNSDDVTSYFYSVTAVKDGKESCFSNEVMPPRVLDILPYDIQEDDLLVSLSPSESLNELPYTTNVLMADKKTVKSYPVNYTIAEDDYAKSLGIVEYNYEVVGTRLTGHVSLNIGEGGDYEKSVKSPILLDYSMYNNEIDPKSVNNVDVTAVNGIDASDIDLTKTKKYDKHTRVEMSIEAIDEKTQIEISRMTNGGLHDETMKKLWDKPVVNYNDPKNTVEYIKEKYGDVFADGDTNLDDIKVTADNIIETKIEDDERRIKEGNNIELSLNDGFIYEADFIEEEYLAINFINQEEEIRIDVLPTLMNAETLFDVTTKVMYQNPYFMGLRDYNIEYYNDGSVYMIPEYKFTKEEATRMQNEIKEEATRVVNEIIKPGMTDREKVDAIWTYLEKNTTYDNAALASAEKYDYKYADPEFEPTFTTYGILCNKVGVCMSYAYVTDLLCKMCDVNSMVLVGYATSGVGHAWNAIELDGKWYWFDATNTYDATLVQRFIYLTSSDFAINDIGYVLRPDYELDNRLTIPLNGDNQEDWYYSHGLVANNNQEFVNCIKKAYDESVKNGEISFAIRVNYEMDVNDTQLISDCADALISCGLSEEDLLDSMGPLYMKPYAIIVTDKEAFRQKVLESYQQ